MNLGLILIIGFFVCIFLIAGFKKIIKIIINNLDDSCSSDINSNKLHNKPEDDSIVINNKYNKNKGTDALPKKRRGTDIEVAGFEEVYSQNNEKRANHGVKPDIDELRESSHFKDIVDDINENMRRDTNSALDGHYIEKKLKSEGKDFGRF